MSNFARPAPNWQHRPTTLFMLARYADRDQIVVDTTYQRPFGYWDDGDRVALFDTIFNGGDIGKMVFADLGWQGDSKERVLEIIDGQHRFQAIVDYLNDRWQYRGFTYSQLSQADRRCLEDYQVSVFWMLNPTYKERVMAFLHVNRTGRPQSENHLAMVLDIIAKT